MEQSGLKKQLERNLAFLARRIIRKYRPDVIGVTGSVGKTSTKEAIFTVLSGSFGVRKNEGNLNNEFGLPLSIIGAQTGGRNPFAWAKVLLKGAGMLVKSRPFPEIIILEMGADHPGDLKKLTDIARPRVSVTTAVAPVHIEFFPSLDALAEEKSTLASVTDPDGYVILNADDPLVAGFRSKAQARVLTYGFSSAADVRATDVRLAFGKPSAGGALPTLRGANFRLQFDGRSADVFLNNAVGKPTVLASLAGAAVGLVYGRELNDVAASLAHYIPPKGRLRPLEGQRGALIIDDSYNASPRAALASLEFLSELAAEIGRMKPAEGSSRRSHRPRRIAVLGNMAELGAYTEAGHREVGEAARKTVDLLVTVGDLADGIARAALRKGMRPNQVASFLDRESAIHLLKQELDVNDLVLVKGSQSARMEKVVAALLANPARSNELLVRQGPEWKS